MMEDFIFSGGFELTSCVGKAFVCITVLLGIYESFIFA